MLGFYRYVYTPFEDEAEKFSKEAQGIFRYVRQHRVSIGSA